MCKWPSTPGCLDLTIFLSSYKLAGIPQLDTTHIWLSNRTRRLVDRKMCVKATRIELTRYTLIVLKIILKNMCYPNRISGGGNIRQNSMLDEGVPTGEIGRKTRVWHTAVRVNNVYERVLLSSSSCTTYYNTIIDI